MKRAYIKKQSKDPKKRLQKQADKLWFEKTIKAQPNCKLCGTPAVQVHHFFPKGQYSQLRYDLDNAISLCLSHHFRLHHADPTITGQIIDKCGIGWYHNLSQKAVETPRALNTISYYENIIKNLSEST